MVMACIGLTFARTLPARDVRLQQQCCGLMNGCVFRLNKNLIYFSAFAAGAAPYGSNSRAVREGTADWRASPSLIDIFSVPYLVMSSKLE